MAAVDRISRKCGQRAMGLAAGEGADTEGPLGRAWTMQRSNRSPRYTTRWDELPRGQV